MSDIEQNKSRDPVTSQYVNGVLEKATLKDEISELIKQLNQANSKNYDLTKKVEKLEKEVFNLNFFCFFFLATFYSCKLFETIFKFDRLHWYLVYSSFY